MNTRRIFVINVVGIIVVLALIYIGYTFYYRSTHYISTDDASIQATMVPIQSEYAGTLVTWSVRNGAKVASGQQLGTVDPADELSQLGASGRVSSVAHAVKAAGTLSSPISGTVAEANAQDGQTVMPGVPVAEVVDTGHPYVTANITETAIRHVQVGDTVDIYVDAYPNLSLQGTVQSIGMAANSFFSLIPPNNPASGNYTKVTQTIPVRIALSGTAGADLIPGTNVTVRIHRTNN